MDVRSAALNRWSLKQAQFALSRQRVAQLFGMPTHFPRLDGGYEFEGQYEEFFALDSADDPSENLRMYTFNEARRAGRLAEVAVEGAYMSLYESLRSRFGLDLLPAKSRWRFF